MAREKEIGRSGAIALGGAVALTGAAIVAVALFGKDDGFHSPRWVVACAGAAFLFFGGWTAALYALGYDPKRPNETLPRPGVQLLVLIPGLFCFAAPFHWVAFGRGPRAFSSTFSLFSFSARGRASEISGRVMFGIGCLLIDTIIVIAVVRLWRQQAGSGSPLPRGGTISSPTPSDGPADSP
ncbi:MAG TPA: hypothetical protein VE007_01445 [Thermoanaerobaculia bacterium]|nr:hypothetical protein [Thermoanaerobaculia bacterium]